MRHTAQRLHRGYCLLALLILLVPYSWADSPAYPSLDKPPKGEFVAEEAGLIQPEQKDHMNQLLQAVLRDLDIELDVASVPSLYGLDINTFTNGLFENWKVGSRTKASRGLLLVIAAKEQIVRFEVSYELEGIFTDSFVSYIEHKQMAPYFEHQRISQGIEATVELIARRAYEGVLGHSYDPTAQGPSDLSGYRSGGAGAQTSVTLNSAATPKPLDVGITAPEAFGAQSTPAEAWEKFLEVNRRHIKDPQLGLYDEAAKGLMRGVSTDAGQDHIAQLYANKASTVRQQGDRAAILFLEDPNNLLAPWFFHKATWGWQLDGSMYPEVVGYNHLNQWFFKRRDHPYTFAFSDYHFDQHGFAFYRPQASAQGGGYLGVSAYWYGYQGQGVLVYEVVRGSPAEQAGLEVGDIILSYAGVPVTKPAEFTKRIRADQPGETVTLEIVRGALQEPLTLRLDDGSVVEVRPVTIALSPPKRLTVRATLGER